MIMILLDSSVVIDYTRGKDPNLAALFAVLDLAVCGVVRSELLAGVRSSADRAKVIAILNGLLPISIPDSLWDAVGDNLAELRRNGLTLPLADVVIATLGIELDVEVWSRDPHFQAMQRVLPTLKLFQEPP